MCTISHYGISTSIFYIHTVQFLLNIFDWTLKKTALVCVVSNILHHIDAGLIVALVSLCMSAVNDIVNHRTRLGRYEVEFGVHGPEVYQIDFYLEDRSDAVRVGSSTSLSTVDLRHAKRFRAGPNTFRGCTCRRSDDGKFDRNIPDFLSKVRCMLYHSTSVSTAWF